jgi:hypothetical protein
MTIILQELLDDKAIEELKPLLRVHYQEIGSPHGAPLDPFWEVYKAQATYVTMRKFGHLTGYWIGWIGPEMHHRTVTAATTDIFWTHPIVRGGPGLGSGALALFRGVERILRGAGVRMWYTDLPLHRHYGKFLQALGHQEVSKYFAKDLGSGRPK